MTEYLAIFFHFCLGTIFLIFGLNLILRRGLVASKLFGIQFTTVAIQLLISYFLSENNIINHPHFFRTLSPLIYLYGPLAYLIQEFLLYPQKKFNWINAIHFLPFLFHFIECIPFYLSPLESKIIEINYVLAEKNYSVSTKNFGWIPMNTHDYFKGMSIFVYTFWTGVNLFKYFKLSGNNLVRRNNKLFIKWISIDYALKFFALISITYFYSIYKLTGIGFSQTIIYLTYIINFVFDALFILIYPQLLIGPTLGDFFPKSELKRFTLTSSTLGNDIHNEHSFIIQKLFETELIFLNHDLNITYVAKRLNLSTTQISTALKLKRQQSFPEFVNSYRLQYIKDQLSKNSNWKKYTIDALAFEAGFGNRQTLHLACKKMHGLTASQYLFEENQR
jgi:AraC-like DNA-binding protein